MIPPAPMPFVAFGAVWFGGPVCGLWRALAAPWLDPWWLARGMPSARLRAPAPVPAHAAPAAQTGDSPPPAPLAPPDRPAREATILPFDLARARAARRKGAERPG